MVSRVVEIHGLVCVGASVYVRFCGPLYRTLAIARRWRTTVCFCCGCCVVTGYCHLHKISDCELCVGWHQRLYPMSEVGNAASDMMLY